MTDTTCDPHSTSRPLTSRDLLRLRMASDPRISPQGTQVAWILHWLDEAQNQNRSAIMVTDLKRDETRRLTGDDVNATQPRWSPDGRYLAYLGTPTDKTGPEAQGADDGRTVHAASVVGHQRPQLFVMETTGDKRRFSETLSKPRRLTDLLGGAAQLAWSPDGSSSNCFQNGHTIAITSYVHPERGLETVSAQEPPSDPYERFNRDVLIVRRLHWKMDGAGYFGDYRRQVVLVPFVPGDTETPEPRLLTQGQWDLDAPTWSPDGRIIAVTGNTAPDADFVRRQYIYLLNPGDDAPVQPQELFGLEEMRDGALNWSPDGQTIAISGHDDASLGHYGNQGLWLVDVSDGTGRCLTQSLDRTLGNAVITDVGGYGGATGPRWAPDGQSLLALLSDRATTYLCRFDASDGAPTRLTGKDQIVAAFDLFHDGASAMALIHEPDNPGDLYLVDLQESPSSSAAVRRVTNINRQLLDEVQVSLPVPFTFESGGTMIDAWIIPPVDHRADKRFPAILYHGGGPGGMRAANFTFEYQLYAARGYAVVYCNAHGCQGYGESFCTAILGAWGEQDYHDNMACIEHACSRFEDIDRERLATAGGSYGGYQVNWILGHRDLFKAAVSDRSVSNRYSSYGTSDIGHLREFEFGGGPPWETTARYLRQTPLMDIGAAATPTLVVHSALDHRCPVEQGEQLYMALKRLGVPTEFVRFSNESHGLSRGGRPWHRVFRLDRYLEWFHHWLPDEKA